MLVLLIAYKRHHIKKPNLGASEASSNAAGGEAGDGVSLSVAGDGGSRRVDEGEGDAAQRSTAGDGEFAADTLSKATVDACGLPICERVIRNVDNCMSLINLTSARRSGAEGGKLLVKSLGIETILQLEAARGGRGGGHDGGGSSYGGSIDSRLRDGCNGGGSSGLDGLRASSDRARVRGEVNQLGAICDWACSIGGA